MREAMAEDRNSTPLEVCLGASRELIHRLLRMCDCNGAVREGHTQSGVERRGIIEPGCRDIGPWLSPSRLSAGASFAKDLDVTDA